MYHFRRVFFALAATLLLTLTGYLTPARMAPADPECIVTVRALNLRAEPTTANRPIRVLRQDTVLIPVARNAAGTWLEVELEDGDTQGWVSASSTFVECTIDVEELPISPQDAADEPDSASRPAVRPTSGRNAEQSDTDSGVGQGMSGSEFDIPTPEAIGYESDTFTWEWTGLREMPDDMDWYFDIKLFPAKNASVPYDVRVAEVEDVQKAGFTWRYRAPIRDFPCGSHWAIQIAQRNEDGSYAGPVSEESIRVATERGCRGGGGGSEIDDKGFETIPGW